MSLPSGGISFASSPPASRSRYTGSAAFRTSNWPSGFAHRSSAAFGNRTGRGAHRATRQFWSNGSRAGSSLNSLNRPFKPGGKVVFDPLPALALVGLRPEGAFGGRPAGSGLQRNGHGNP